jgi:hypothetical protein
VVSNLASVNSGGTANRVAAVFAGEKMAAAGAAPKPVERQSIDVDAASLGRFAGHYQLEGGMLVRVEKKDGKLMATPGDEAPSELKPPAPNRFFSERANAEVEFTSTSGGGMKVNVAMPTGRMEGERFTPAEFDPKDNAEYPGDYWSEELETQYTIVAKDGKLFASHAHHGDIALTPIAKDQFRGAYFFLQQVRFLRGASGSVTGLTAGGGRVAGVRFVRR